MLPAAGQGALAVECRADRRRRARRRWRPLDDAATRACVAAERALLAALEAGCTAPVGALAEVVEGGDGAVELSLRAFAGSLDGTVDLRRSIVGPVDGRAARPRLAAVLLADGASEISTSIAQPAPAASHQTQAASGDDLAAVPAAEQPQRPTQTTTPERAS